MSNVQHVHISGHRYDRVGVSFFTKSDIIMVSWFVGWYQNIENISTGPFLSYTKPHMKLEPSSATFVDALHTDSGFYGSPQSFGHADFFANGGRSQDQPICILPTVLTLGCEIWVTFVL